MASTVGIPASSAPLLKENIVFLIVSLLFACPA
jgi:hypothetical protein